MKKGGIAAVALFIAAYVATIVLYSHTGMGRPHEIAHGEPTADGTTVVCDVEELAPVKGVLTVNLTVVPGPALLDPVTHGLKEDLSVAVASAVVPTKRTWVKDVVPGVFPVQLTVTGDPSSWPFDRYETGSITVELFHGRKKPERASVTVFDRIPGWKVDVENAGNRPTPTPYHVVLHRSPSTAAFAAIILAVLITLAGLALFVAVQTVAFKREFFPPMTTWYAALLFSVVPLRNALPDAPPIGFWVDVTVVLWVIVVLVISMALYVYCWWRHVNAKPATPPVTAGAGPP
ncbi:DUF4436 domain-containing protein [Mycobacterium sp.]|uniref:DUF4436 domain-containing protein n=1 Tax=Mycobacterium sp. TaxID=1785 RepID=UPI0025CC4B26|nr:DUF4436 domain-containing protein [Mycobacterium sp.]